MHMGEKYPFPGRPDPKTAMSAAAAGSLLRQRAMKTAGLTEAYFMTKHRVVAAEAKREHASSGATAGLEEFVTRRLALNDQRVAAGLAHLRRQPEQFWRALESGTIKICYIDMSSPETMRLGVQTVAPGALSRKEVLQATRQLRLDPTIRPIVFLLARCCMTFFMKSDFERWEANAFDEHDDEVARAANILAQRLASDPELHRNDASDFIKLNCPNVSGRRFNAEVWPNARQKAGLSRRARSGPKRKR
jgi:hypothetical protein